MRRACPIVAVVVSFGVILRAFTDDSPIPIPRIRTDSPAIAALLTEARQSSPTFKALVDTIDASDGLVYIDLGECRARVRACMAHSLRLAGPNRLLRVKIDPRRSRLEREPFDPELMGLLGHELQHVVEVLSRPNLRTSADVAAFYLHEGTFSTGTAMETVEATHTGLRVEDEIRRARKNLSNR